MAYEQRYLCSKHNTSWSGCSGCITALRKARDRNNRITALHAELEKAVREYETLFTKPDWSGNALKRAKMWRILRRIDAEKGGSDESK